MQTHDKNFIFGLYGAGGCARGVMPFVLDSLQKAFPESVRSNIKLYFVESQPIASEVNGYPLISEDDFFNIPCSIRYFNVAIANSTVREDISIRCMSRGGIPLTLNAPSAIAYDANEIGVGAIWCANTMITSNVKIGKFFHANIYSYVEHDCVIGDYVTFAPSVRCNGNVHIQDHAYIGAGAVIKQGSLAEPLVIGKGAVVGMGAVVTKSVPPYVTVVGNPARPFVKNS